jgi:AAA ATPase domain
MRYITLRSLEISNFRSLRSVSLQGLKGYNLFIGRNNVGKSNILHAIDQFLVAICFGKLERRIERTEAAELSYLNRRDPITLTGVFELVIGNRIRLCSATVRIQSLQAETFAWISRLLIEVPSDAPEGSQTEFSYEVPDNHIEEFIQKLETLGRVIK